VANSPPVDYPQLDEDGYLLVRPERPTPLSTTLSGRTYFQRQTLESALWAFGEDTLLAQVQSCISPGVVGNIGERHAVLIFTPDPALSSGAGYGFDRALAMAAVEVLTGEPRPLARKRRRATPG
jgi:hypothetical protein